MFDTDKFIECVHSKPALWDKSLPQYSDRNERSKCWVTIGETMFSDWSQIDVKERNLKLLELKNKWRHIRDNFIKCLSVGKSGAPAPSKKKKYVYAEALTFLLNSLQKRPKRTSGSISPEDLNDTVDDPPNKVEEEVEATIAPVPTRISKKENCSRKMKKKSPFQSQLLTQLSLSALAEEDPDRLYIMSLLKDYKKLTEDEKLDFKLTNLHFFRSVRQRQAQNNVPPGQSQTHTWNQPTSVPPQHLHIHSSYFMPGVAGPSNPPFTQEARASPTPSYSTVFSPTDSVNSSDY